MAVTERTIRNFIIGDKSPNLSTIIDLANDQEEKMLNTIVSGIRERCRSKFLKENKEKDFLT